MINTELHEFGNFTVSILEDTQILVEGRPYIRMKIKFNDAMIRYMVDYMSVADARAEAKRWLLEQMTIWQSQARKWVTVGRS